MDWRYPMDALGLLEMLFSVLTVFVAAVTLVIAFHLTKFFKGGAFMKVWRTLYMVPFFMALAEIGWHSGITVLWGLAHLGSCLMFLYSLYLFYRAWTKMGKIVA